MGEGEGEGEGGAGVSSSYSRLMGMCIQMGWHFHDWIEYYGFGFSIVLQEWGRILSGFGGQENTSN